MMLTLSNYNRHNNMIVIMLMKNNDGDIKLNVTY